MSNNDIIILRVKPLCRVTVLANLDVRSRIEHIITQNGMINIDDVQQPLTIHRLWCMLTNTDSILNYKSTMMVSDFFGEKFPGMLPYDIFKINRDMRIDWSAMSSGRNIQMFGAHFMAQNTHATGEVDEHEQILLTNPPDTPFRLQKLPKSENIEELISTIPMGQNGVIMLCSCQGLEDELTVLDPEYQYPTAKKCGIRYWDGWNTNSPLDPWVVDCRTHLHKLRNRYEALDTQLNPGESTKIFSRITGAIKSILVWDSCVPWGSVLLPWDTDLTTFSSLKPLHMPVRETCQKYLMVLNPESELKLVEPDDFPSALTIQREVSPFVSGFIIVEANESMSFDQIAYNIDVVNYYKRLQKVIMTYDPSYVEQLTQIKAGSIPIAIDFSHCSFNARAELVRIGSSSSGDSSGSINWPLDTNSTLGIGSLRTATGDDPGYTYRSTLPPPPAPLVGGYGESSGGRQRISVDPDYDSASGITYGSTRPPPPAGVQRMPAHSLAPLQVPLFRSSGDSGGPSRQTHTSRGSGDSGGPSRQTHTSRGSGDSGGPSRQTHTSRGYGNSSGPSRRGPSRQSGPYGRGRNNGKGSSRRWSPRRRNVRRSRKESRRKSVRKSRRKSVRKSRRKSVRKSRRKSRR